MKTTTNLNEKGTEAMTNPTKNTTIPAAGHYLVPDGWKIGEALQAGDDFCPLRLPGGNGMYELAVKVEITGRKVRDDGSLRVKITFIKEDEPNVEHRGYLYPGNTKDVFFNNVEWA